MAMVTEARRRAAAWVLVPFLALAGWALYSIVDGDPEEEAAAAQRALPEGERGIRFAWPVPSEVEVTELETTIVPVQTVEYRYTVELRETGAAGRLVVRKRDFEVLKIDGLEVADDEAFGNLTAPLELAKMSPDIYINPNGDVQDVEPWGTFYERLEQRMNELVNEQMISPEHMQSVRTKMRDPQRQQIIRNASVGFWTLWVNGWLDLDFNENAEIVDDDGVFVLPDGDLKAPQILRHEGQVVDDPEFVRLSAQRRASGPRVTAAVKASFRDGGTRARITGAEIVATAWVELLPETMQPIRAESETRHIITSESFQIPDRVTGQKYVFDWKQ